MRGFFKNTVAGGLLFLVPFGVLLIVFGKIVPLVRKVTDPLGEYMPVESVVGLKIPVLLTFLLILFACFLAGLFANTAAAKYLVSGLENSVLGKIPGYNLIKSMSEDVVGVDGDSANQVVLVRSGETWQFGLKIDEISEGKLIAVFIPESPTPQTGGLLIVDASCVQLTNLSINQVFACLQNRGAGVQKLLKLEPLAL
jgi:uncharacterized membrane protein